MGQYRQCDKNFAEAMCSNPSQHSRPDENPMSGENMMMHGLHKQAR
jgi:hypothetical protein